MDLEDSVAADAKQKARETTRYFLRDTLRSSQRPRLYVRINAFDSGMSEADLQAVMRVGPDGIVLPKSASGRDVARLHAMLSVHEAETGTPDGRTGIIAIATRKRLPRCSNSAPIRV